jgi:hypothetical protein
MLTKRLRISFVKGFDQVILGDFSVKKLKHCLFLVFFSTFQLARPTTYIYIYIYICNKMLWMNIRVHKW